MKIFVITTIKDIVPEYVGSHFANIKEIRSRSVGWFPYFSEAETAVLENHCDIEGHYYRYVVIEEMGPGIYPGVVETPGGCETWYKWDGDYGDENGGYKKLSEKPKMLKHMISFSIG